MNHKYHATSRFFHWSIALLIIVNVLVALYMDDLPKEDKLAVLLLHRSFGLLILELIVIQFFWILFKPAPTALESLPAFEIKVSKIVQRSLYWLMFLVPLFGYLQTITAAKSVSFFNLYTLPPVMAENPLLHEIFEESHEILAWTLVALFSLHIAAAIKHLLQKDGIFERMWFRG